MPASFIAEIILQAVFEVTFYYLGRLIVPAISLGRWKSDPLLRELPKKKRRWHGLYHKRGERIYLTSEATTLVGLVGFVIIAVALWILFRD